MKITESQLRHFIKEEIENSRIQEGRAEGLFAAEILDIIYDDMSYRAKEASYFHKDRQSISTWPEKVKILGNKIQLSWKNGKKVTIVVTGD